MNLEEAKLAKAQKALLSKKPDSEFFVV